MMSEAVAFVSVEDFLAGEQDAERRHELVGGRIYLMAGATERHDLAAGLLYEAIAQGARAAGCRPFTSNRLLRTRTGSMYYPDVMVACGKAPDRMYEEYPTLVVEVLSRSTAGTDRREKALAYTAIETLKMLLLVDPDNPRIEAAWLDDDGRLVWDVFGPGDIVLTGYGDLDVERYYDDIDATATTTS
jgi:Uma2 family endonuclease